MAFTKKQWEEWKKSNPEKWKERSEKIAAAHKGRSIHDTHKAAISASMKGRTLSDDHRKRISMAMKRAKSSKLNNNISEGSFDKARVTVFVLLALVIFSFVFGFTNLGFFIAPPNNFELYSNISVGSDADVVSEHIVFDLHKPENCNDGVLIYDKSGTQIDFYVTGEVYVDGLCSEVDVHFFNTIYKSSDEFDVYYVNPTPRHGSIFNRNYIDVAAKTNKIATFALLEVNDSNTIINHPMAGAMKDWIYSLTDLKDSTYYIKVYAQDQDGNIVTSDTISFVIDSTAQAQEFYFLDQPDDSEEFSLYYIIAPDQDIVFDVSETIFEAEGSEKQSKPPQFNIPEIIPDIVETDSFKESIILSDYSVLNYNTDIQYVFYDFDYPMQVETSFKAKFKGPFGGKHDLRFEANGTYYEYDLNSIYYRIDGVIKKNFNFAAKGNRKSKNVLTYDNLGHGITVDYQVNDFNLMENITIPQLNFLSLGSYGEVVLESDFNIPIDQNLIVYSRGNPTIITYETLMEDRIEINLQESDDTSVKYGEGFYLTSNPNIPEYAIGSRHMLESDIYSEIKLYTIENGRKFKKLATFDPIDFVDENGKTLFFIPQSKVIDANGNELFLKHEIENVNGQLKFRTIIPAEWLNNAQYPIIVDPETQVFSYPSEYGARLYSSLKSTWRDSDGYWYIIHVNGTGTTDWNTVLSTNNTAGGTWRTVQLVGPNAIIFNGTAHHPAIWMDKFDNTLHLVTSFNGTGTGNKWNVMHSECKIDNSSSYTLTNCWTMANGTVGYDHEGDATYFALLPDIAIDRDNNLYWLYNEESTTAAGKRDLKVKKYNESSGWQSEVTVYSANPTDHIGAYWGSIDVSARGYVHVVYVNSSVSSSVSDNRGMYVNSTNGGVSYTSPVIIFAGQPQCTKVYVTNDDVVIAAIMGNTNDIMYNMKNETGIWSGQTNINTGYNNCPSIGSAANGGAVIFWSERDTYRRQAIARKPKESTGWDAWQVWKDFAPTNSTSLTNRSGDHSAPEVHATIYSTGNNIGLAYTSYTGTNALWHNTDRVYDSGTTNEFGQQKYVVLPTYGDDINAMDNIDYSDNHMVVRDRDGYWYILMIADWDTSFTIDGGSFYMSKSLTNQPDANGIVYFDKPKKIAGTGSSNTTGPAPLIADLGGEVPYLIQDVSGWMNPLDDHLHLTFAAHRDYGGGFPTGPYNDVYYMECKNLSSYNKKSSWSSHSNIFGTSYYVQIAGAVDMGTSSYNYNPNIIGDKYGNIYIAYVNDSYNNNTERLGVRKRAAGASFATWGSPVNIDSGEIFRNPILDIDSQNNLYAGYQHIMGDGSNRSYRVRKSVDQGANWAGFPTTAAQDAISCYLSCQLRNGALVVTPADRIHVAVHRGPALAIYERIETTWTNATSTSWPAALSLTGFETYLDQGAPSIGVDSDDNVHIHWNNMTNLSGYDRYRRNNSYAFPGTWSTATQIDSHESDTYRGATEGSIEYKAAKDSTYLGYLALKASNYGGYSFGLTYATPNRTILDHCTTLHTPGLNYEMNKNLSGNNSYACLTFLYDDTVIDCKGYALNATTSAGSVGVYLKDLDNITIKNCIINGYNSPMYLTNITNSNFSNITIYNVSGAYSHAIQMRDSFGNNFEHMFVNGSTYAGIHMQDSSNNTFYNVSLNYTGTTDWASLALYKNVTLNNFTNLVINKGKHLIYLRNNSDDNYFSNINLTDSTYWDIFSYISEPLSDNNTFINATFNRTRVSFVYNSPLYMKYATDPSGGSDPLGYQNISHFINITNTTASDYIFFNFSYDDDDLDDAYDNETMKIFKWDGALWIEGVGTPNDHDQANNIVYANITNFSSIFAPMQQIGIPCHITTTVTLTEDLVCDNGMNITSTGNLDAGGYNINVTGADVVNEGIFTAGSGIHNFTESLISIGIIYSDSSIIECGTNWNTTLGTFYRNTSTIKMYGTGTFSHQTGWGAQTPYNVHVGYSGHTTTLGNTFYIYNDFYIEGGTFSMGDYSILSYDYYVAPYGYLYGSGTITSTGGKFRLRHGSNNGIWNNTIFVPHLSVEKINSPGNFTLKQYTDINAGFLDTYGADNDNHLIMDTNGYSINVSSLQVGMSGQSHVWLLGKSNQQINVSEDLTVEANAIFNVTTTSIKSDGDSVIKGFLDGGTGNHIFGILTIESGGIYNATSGITEINNRTSFWAYRNFGTMNHNEGTFKFTCTDGYVKVNASTGTGKNFYNVIIDTTNKAVELSNSDMKVENDFNITTGSFLNAVSSGQSGWSLEVVGDAIVDGLLFMQVGYDSIDHKFGSLTINSGGEYRATNGTTNIDNYMSINGGTYTYNGGSVNISGTNTKFATANNVKLEKVTSLPSDPDNYVNISYYVNITNLTPTGGFGGDYFNITYDNSDPDDETMLEMWKYNGTSWTQNGIVVEGVNITGDYVYANITGFSIFAPLEFENQAPNITQITVDDYDNVDTRINNITLYGGITRTIICNGSASDPNGYTDISKVNATFYDVAVGSGASDNNNTHYTDSSCSLLNGAGNSVDFNCTFDVYYYANSTNWQCNATVYDVNGLSGSDTDDNHIDELLSIDTSSLYVYFGTVNPNNISSEQILDIINKGNVRIDLSLNGTNFDCGVPVGLLKYNCTAASQNYDIAMANLTTTATNSYCTGFDLVKTTTGANSTDDIYWKLLNPLGTVGGKTCNATIRIAGIKG